MKNHMIPLKILILFIVIAIVTTGLSFYLSTSLNPTSTEQNLSTNSKQEIQVNGSLFRVFIPLTGLIYDQETNSITYHSPDYELKPGLEDVYKQLQNDKESNDVVIIYPSFTEAAYSDNGFYAYYNKLCDEKCLTVPIRNDFTGGSSSSRTGFQVLSLLGYPHITDSDVDKNPELLKQYKKIILLHNEYVTKKEFDAIISHPKVLYLYPNALYAEVSVDYPENSITLERGHAYPNKEISNGFDWIHDNSIHEYDYNCTGWKFREVDNGSMLDCNPEDIIIKDAELLKAIKIF